jgi:hypothetical protein
VNEALHTDSGKLPGCGNSAPDQSRTYSREARLLPLSREASSHPRKTLITSDLALKQAAEFRSKPLTLGVGLLSLPVL